MGSPRWNLRTTPGRELQDRFVRKEAKRSTENLGDGTTLNGKEPFGHREELGYIRQTGVDPRA
eukprot:2728932-Pyramimonas_sp.AAC.1